MNHRELLLLMAALLGTGAHALALDSAPPGINVIIIDETERGWEKGVLDRYGIASRASRINRGAHAEALREALGDQNVRMRLAVPTACPTAGTRDACASVRRIKDVDLPDAIDEARQSTLLVLWPEAAYFPQQQLYVGLSRRRRACRKARRCPARSTSATATGSAATTACRRRSKPLRRSWPR